MVAEDEELFENRNKGIAYMQKIVDAEDTIEVDNAGVGVELCETSSNNGNKSCPRRHTDDID
jgi:hypothetical protein